MGGQRVTGVTRERAGWQGAARGVCGQAPYMIGAAPTSRRRECRSTMSVQRSNMPLFFQPIVRAKGSSPGGVTAEVQPIRDLCWPLVPGLIGGAWMLRA